MAYFNDIIGIVAANLEIEYIHIRETFKEDCLAFHDGLAGERPDIAQSEDSRSVGHYRNQISAARVFKGIMRIRLNGQAWHSDARRIGQAQIALRAAWLGGSNFNFSRARPSMVVERLLLGERHGILLGVSILAGGGSRSRFAMGYASGRGDHR